jgi:hypothetical protein
VAELADAQVSEACDGDIVEVQVLSSAPTFPSLEGEPARAGSLFVLPFVVLIALPDQENCHRKLRHGVFVLETAISWREKGKWHDG